MEHFIKIAEIKVIRGPGILKTVVGSCIALCIWDKEEKIGGMVHIMMPRVNNSKTSFPRGKYADTAVHALYKEMISRNCEQKHLIASVIGGASLFNSKLVNNGSKSIGIDNYETVMKQLYLHRISVNTEDVGGNSGRRVLFDCSNGEVIVTMLNRKSPVVVQKVLEE